MVLLFTTAIAIAIIDHYNTRFSKTKIWEKDVYR